MKRRKRQGNLKSAKSETRKAQKYRSPLLQTMHRLSAGPGIAGKPSQLTTDTQAGAPANIVPYYIDLDCSPAFPLKKIDIFLSPETTVGDLHFLLPSCRSNWEGPPCLSLLFWASIFLFRSPSTASVDCEMGNLLWWGAKKRAGAAAISPPPEAGRKEQGLTWRLVGMIRYPPSPSFPFLGLRHYATLIQSFMVAPRLVAMRNLFDASEILFDMRWGVCGRGLSNYRYLPC